MEGTKGGSSVLELATDQLLGVVAAPEVAVRRAELISEAIQALHGALSDLSEKTISTKPNESVGGVAMGSETVFMKWLCPSNIFAVGDVHVAASTGEDAAICVEMPARMVFEKDHLNMRYVRKRALFLREIQRKLKKHDAFSLQWRRCEYQMKPVLVGDYKDQKHEGQVLRLIIRTCVRCEYLKERRIAPKRNAVRLPDPEEPTPFYNQLLLEDMCLWTNHESIVEHMEESPVLMKTFVLIKVWLKRCNTFSSTGLRTLHVLLLLSFLQRNRVIIPQMNCWQAFRAFVTWFSSKVLAGGVIRLASDAVHQEDEGFTDMAFTQCFPMSILDFTGYVNLSFEWSHSYLAFLERVFAACAQRIASTELSSTAQMPLFQQLFQRQRAWMGGSDTFIKIDVRQARSIKTSRIEKASSDCTSARFRRDELVWNALTKGLGNRARSVCVLASDARQMLIGISLDPNEAFRTLDVGPSSDEKEAAAAFREFWGTKSTLRRFRDGRICEAVLWQEVSSQTKELMDISVLEQVVTFVVDQHADVDASCVQVLGHQLQELVQRPGTELQDITLVCQQALEKLRTVLMQDPGIPLAVRQVECVHPLLRGCSVVLPEREQSVQMRKWKHRKCCQL